jgi:hypothetical protein
VYTQARRVGRVKSCIASAFQSRERCKNIDRESLARTFGLQVLLNIISASPVSCTVDLRFAFTEIGGMNRGRHTRFIRRFTSLFASPWPTYWPTLQATAAQLSN